MSASAFIAVPVAQVGRWILQRSQTRFSLLDQGLVSGLGFLTGIAAARLVGIAEFGQFAVLMIFAGLGQNLHNALIIQPLMSVAGTPRGRSPAYYGSALMATAVVSVVIALAVMASVAALELAEHRPLWPGLVLAAGALTLAQNLLFTVRRILFALGRGAEGLATDIARAVLLVAVFALVWVPRQPVHVDQVTWLLAFATVLPALAAMRPIWRKARGRMRTIAFVKRCWPMGKWMLPTVLVTFCQEQIVWLIVGFQLGDAQVGGLRAAQYLVSLAYPFMASLENVVPIEASRAYLTGGADKLRAYIVRVTAVFSPIALGLPVVAAVSAPFWLRTLFGEQFQDFAPCLRIFAVVVLIVFVRDMVGYFFRATQRTKIIFQSFVVSAIATLIVILPLIHAFEVEGAAAGIAIGQGLSLVNFVGAALKGRRPRRA